VVDFINLGLSLLDTQSDGFTPYLVASKNGFNLSNLFINLDKPVEVSVPLVSWEILSLNCLVSSNYFEKKPLRCADSSQTYSTSQDLHNFLNCRNIRKKQTLSASFKQLVSTDLLILVLISHDFLHFWEQFTFLNMKLNKSERATAISPNSQRFSATQPEESENCAHSFLLFPCH
jgi:hypothetical protein